MSSLNRSRRSRIAPNAFAVENLEVRQLYAVSPLAMGLNTNYVTSTNYKALASLMRSTGSTSVRLWYGFSGYDDRSIARASIWAQKFSHDGFDVTMTVSPDNGLVGTAQQTTDLFKFLVSIPGLTNAVDRWEIGNEEDSSYYWKGSLKQYVGQFLAPASAVLHGAGELVVSGGVSWNPADVQALVDQGMLHYVDYVGYHPYRSGYADLVAKVAKVKAIAGGKPLVATEWNVRGHEKDSSSAAWAADVAKFWPIIRDNFYAAYYYAATVVDTPAGPAGLQSAAGVNNQPFYNVYNTFQYTMPALPGGGGSAGGGSGTGGGATGGSGTGGNTGGGSNSTGGGAATGGSSTGGATDNSTSGSNTGGSTKGSTSGGTGTKGTTGGSTSGSTSGPKDGTTKGSTGSTSPGTKPTGSTTNGGGKTGGGKSGTGKTPTPPKPVVQSKPKPTPPAVTSIALMNADNDTVVKTQSGITGGIVIDLATLATANLTFVAEVNSKVKSVQWSINGATLVDSAGAFTLFGEKHHNVIGTTFKPRSYVLTAQGFGGVGATGTATAVQTFSVTFINTGGGVVDTAAQAANAAYLKRKAAKAAQSAAAASFLNSNAGMLSGVSTAVRRKKH